MGARAESLAKKYEAKAAELTATIQKLSDADWKKVTTAEKWPVGVTAHHVAGGHEPISGIVKTLAAGQSISGFSMSMLDDMNAKHAQEHANAAKADTVALHKKNAAAAAQVVRGLSDADLDRSGTVLTGMPPMTVEQIVTNILINHVDDHMGSIKKTVTG